MNKPAVNKVTRHRRRIHYVDESLQKFLLVGLVLLEAGLAAGLAWLMFQHLNQIIEDNLYRVHLADATSLLPQLISQSYFLLGLFFAVNLLALVAVDLVWRRYVHSILRSFMQLMTKKSQLDFSADPAIASRHQLLDLTKTQREQDRARLTAIRAQLSLLNPDVPTAADAPTVQEVLSALNELLPKTATTAP